MKPPRMDSVTSSRVVLIKGDAGLGNRMLGLLSAILFARLAKRTVVVDWRDGAYADPGTNAFPLLFSSRSVMALEADLPAQSVNPWIWESRLHMNAHELHRFFGLNGGWGCPFRGTLYSFDPNVLHHPEDVIVTWSLVAFVAQLRRHLNGPWKTWSGLSDEAILARLLREELVLHPAIAARVDQVARMWPDRPRIGVHVRHTDRTTNLQRLRRRLDHLLARHPDAVIYLATDAAAVQEDFRRRYPDVLTVPKWFAPSGPLHARSAPCPDRLAMARDSLVEMRLLARCDHLIVNGNSSFSQVARLWWRGDPRRVIDVGSWAWLPGPVRERAWRSRDAVLWAPWLWRARQHLRRQRART